MESPTSLLAAASLGSSAPRRVPRPRRPRLGLTLAGVIAVLAVGAPAADAETRSLKLLSDGPFATDPALPASFLYESADGSRVFFQTDEALAGSDTDATLDAYMRTSAGALVHVSDDPTGADDALDAAVVDASTDLTRVAFATKERLAGTDTDAAYDLYERRDGGELIHLSDDPTGPDADIDVEYERMSADGRRVYFSTAESLSPADTDAVADAYVATLVPDRPTTPRPAVPAADVTAPALTGLRAIPRRSRIRFRLSEPAAVRLVVRRRGARARTRTVRAQAGANRVRVRLRARGRYRVSAVATDAAGNRSAARRIGFRVRGRE